MRITCSAFAASCIMTLALNLPVLAETAHWSYEGETGPDAWAGLHKDFAVCGSGTQQSPIDIQTEKVIEADLQEIQINWNQKVELDVVNNGHVIQESAPDLGSAVINGREYTLKQFHFHAPSEHWIDGRKFPAEVHFVHESGDGSLAVVGILLEGGGENKLFEDTIRVATTAQGQAHSGVEDPRELLPEDRMVYHYQGSLTTPPCSEIVDWNVMQTPVQVPDEALARLTEIARNDARPVQNLARRYVLE